jgi:UDP-N-acetylmuramate dehydrogenase
VSLTVLENAPLRALNTFGVQAHARRLVRVDDAAQLAQALEIASSAGTPLVLGAGSNVLFAGDVDATVLLLRTRGAEVLGESGGATVVQAQAGEPWDAFVRWSLAQGLGGLENLALIPGSVGASPVQNVGAYGVEMRECFEGLDALDLSSGARRAFSPADCEFGYRDSVFRRRTGRRWLIERVRFRLEREPRLRLDYGEIREELARRGIASPGPCDVADAVSAIRRRKLPDPATLGNAGSFFKNPVVEPAIADALRDRHPAMPSWAASAGVKLSAGWLIEQCGWKGRREGDAGVHAAHALVLVNHGAATGAQILALARGIRASVLEHFGVALEPEPLVVGAPFDDPL